MFFLENFKVLPIIFLVFSGQVEAVNIASEKYYHGTYDDNRKLLDNPLVNPILANKIKEFLNDAKKEGFTPIIHEVYRTRKRAEELSKVKSRPASKYSLHVYGLAVDIWMKNSKNENYSYDSKVVKADPLNYLSYKEWLTFIKIGEKYNLINAYKHDDTDHWEYHPNWNKSDWVGGKQYAEPIYQKSKGKTEIDKLKDVWKSAGVL